MKVIFFAVTSSYEDLGDNKINLLYKIDLGNKLKYKKFHL